MKTSVQTVVDNINRTSAEPQLVAQAALPMLINKDSVLIASTATSIPAAVVQ
jgi:hypothetical protein